MGAERITKKLQSITFRGQEWRPRDTIRFTTPTGGRKFFYAGLREMFAVSKEGQATEVRVNFLDEDNDDGMFFFVPDENGQLTCEQVSTFRLSKSKRI